MAEYLARASKVYYSVMEEKRFLLFSFVVLLVGSGFHYLTSDFDDDYLNAYEEIWLYKTDPTKRDTDGDGIPDKRELRESSTTSPINPDMDEDNLTDGEEIYLYKTNPVNPDSDGDGLLDGEEIEYGSDPNDPNDPPP